MELPKPLAALAQDLENWISKDEISLLALESGYEIRETRLLSGYHFLLIHLLGAMDKGMSSSLTQLSMQASHLGLSVGRKSLDDRYTSRSSLFMKRVCQHLLHKRLGQGVSLEVLDQFEGLYVSDSTCVELPANFAASYKGKNGGASEASLKLDCTFDLKSDWSRFMLRSGGSSDQTRIFGAPHGSLWLRDLGYYKTDDFIGLDKQNAFFVSRARMGYPLYLGAEGKEKVDLEALVDQLKPSQVVDRTIHLGAEQRYPFRLVIQRVPEEIAQQKRKELSRQKKDKGRKVSARRLKLCALNVYLTNLDPKEWSVLEVQQLYKIRWQIELIFKIWKSELHLEKVPKMKQERFECHLYALLIYLTLNHRLIQQLKDYYWNDQGIELSEIKLSKMIQIRKWDLQKMIIGSKCSASNFIKVLYQSVLRLARKDIRYQNKNPLFHLC